MKTYKVEVKAIVYVEANNEDEAIENACTEIQCGLNECAVSDYENIECEIVR